MESDQCAGVHFGWAREFQLHREQKPWGSSGKTPLIQKESPCRLCEGLWLIHAAVCLMSVWIEVIRCAWQWSCILLVSNMVQVDELWMLFLGQALRGDLRHSSEVRIYWSLAASSRDGSWETTGELRSDEAHWRTCSHILLCLCITATPETPPFSVSLSLSAMTTHKAWEIGREGNVSRRRVQKRTLSL